MRFNSMMMSSAPNLLNRRRLQAACFDFRGVILDHRTSDQIIPAMEKLLKGLKSKGFPLALISRMPPHDVLEQFPSAREYFGDNIYSGSGRGKLECIKEFAEKLGIVDLSAVAFIDDKPDNILPVAHESSIHVIAFRGSGKYPETRRICREQDIAYAEHAAELERLLFE